jgi:dTDP-4-dehydrorhamnose 3,5-epimerase-like enzyme
MINCKIINLNKKFDKRGKLVIIENNKEVPFKIKRIYYIYEVEKSKDRGGHAHRKLSQLLIAIKGTLKISIYIGKKQRKYSLSDPSKGLLIPPGIWVDKINFLNNAIALAIVDDVYKEKDYLRKFDDYLKFLKS